MSNIKDRYTYVSKKEDNWASICLTGGRYSGIIYQYGKVSVATEENAEGNLTLRFDYNIVDDYGIPEEELHDDFRDLLGDILVDIMDDQLEEDNFEYVSDD